MVFAILYVLVIARPPGEFGGGQHFAGVRVRDRIEHHERLALASRRVAERQVQGVGGAAGRERETGQQRRDPHQNFTRRVMPSWRRRGWLTV